MTCCIPKTNQIEKVLISTSFSISISGKTNYFWFICGKLGTNPGKPGE
jgi:hypothetical protein